MLFVGIIEDINDPMQLGRVRVRVFGLHTDDKTQIPTNDLAWAQVIQPVTSAANSGIGETHAMIKGSTVIVMFADESDMQQPIVLGTIAGKINEHYKTQNGINIDRNKDLGFNDPDGSYPKKEYIGESDLNKLARTNVETPHTLIKERTDNRVKGIVAGDQQWSEPEVQIGKHTYPHNKVTETESGHIIEIDDTSGNERIHIKHKDGSFIEFRNGNVIYKHANDRFEIVSNDDNVYIKGNVNLTVDSNCNTYVKGDYNLRVDGKMRVSVGETIDQTSGGNHTIISPKIDLNP